MLSTADRCLSVGGRDRTVRLWKIAEENQLVFRVVRVNGGSLDEVVPTGPYFVTGSDSGTLSLWSSGRKKPISSIIAHSGPIECLYSPESTDLIISGSFDGVVKLWRAQNDTLELVTELPIPGHVTGAALISNNVLILAVGPRGPLWSVVGGPKPQTVDSRLFHLICITINLESDWFKFIHGVASASPGNSAWCSLKWALPTKCRGNVEP